MQNNQQALSRVTAQSSQIAMGQNTDAVTRVSRKTQPEIMYRVTLQDAPVGKRVPLTCNWINPKGEVVKQNRFETREITTSVWETHCRLSLNHAAPIGTWSVGMDLEGRPLSRTSFQVE
jgi:hypothetical protein